MMNSADSSVLPAYAQCADPRYCWGAVAAGLAIAVAINILLAEAWLGVGLMMVDRETHPGTVVISSAIAWVLSACVALFAGGWVAGRIAPSNDPTVGVLHGAGVWATAAVLTVLLAMSTAGALIGGAAYIVGNGVATVGTVAAGGVAGAAQLMAPNLDSIKKELDDVMSERPMPAGVGSGVTAEADNHLANRSRLGELLVAHFTTEPQTAQNNRDTQELVSLIASEAGISTGAAAKAVEQWDRVWTATVAQWNKAKEEARRAADQARKLTAHAACWAVIAMALGAVAAMVGAGCGTRCRRNLCERRNVPLSSGNPVSSSNPLVANTR